MDDIIHTLESRKTGEKFHDFVLNDAIYFINKAKDALEDGLRDPEGWYNSEQVSLKTFCTLFPQIYATLQQEQSHLSLSKNQQL
jgi:hypothetical protein